MPHIVHATDEESAPLLIAIHHLPSASAFNDPHDPSAFVAAAQRRAEALRMAGLLFWRVGALFGASAVAFGAFGSHGLKKHVSDPNKIAAWSTAAHYQLVHSVALLVARNHPVAGSLFTAGMTLFSGSIYALILDPERFRWMGPVTPVGGLCFIFGWLSLLFTRGAALRI